MNIGPNKQYEGLNLMCKLCQEAVDKHFPDLTQREKSDILMNLTAFPFADGETTAKQVAEVARIGIAESYKKVDEEMTTALREMKEREKAEHEKNYKKEEKVLPEVR